MLAANTAGNPKITPRVRKGKELVNIPIPSIFRKFINSRFVDCPLIKRMAKNATATIPNKKYPYIRS
jgi:hypothetical protein